MIEDQVQVLERELSNARKMVALLLVKAGGSVALTDADLRELDCKWHLISNEIPVTNEWVISVRREL